MIENDEEGMIELIKDYADSHPGWDRDFIDSIEEAFWEYGELTPGQHEACMNIIKRYRLEK